VAQELMGLTTLSMGEISSALAFSTQVTFSDAICRWAGTSPSLWREQFAVES
jgi:transcriptional regulator GlxA family with amidase domain